jgi:post-segregation antitoxin (ccd killing protein)
MARVNVYLPDALIMSAREAGLNISGLTQDAVQDALASVSTDRWLDRLERRQRHNITHEHVLTALEDARSDFGAP